MIENICIIINIFFKISYLKIFSYCFYVSQLNSPNESIKNRLCVLKLLEIDLINKKKYVFFIKLTWMFEPACAHLD